MLFDSKKPLSFSLFSYTRVKAIVILKEVHFNLHIISLLYTKLLRRPKLRKHEASYKVYKFFFNDTPFKYELVFEARENGICIRKHNKIVGNTITHYNKWFLVYEAVLTAQFFQRCKLLKTHFVITLGKRSRLKKN